MVLLVENREKGGKGIMGPVRASIPSFKKRKNKLSPADEKGKESKQPKCSVKAIGGKGLGGDGLAGYRPADKRKTLKHGMKKDKLLFSEPRKPLRKKEIKHR